MAEVKNSFIKSKMNKDLDARLLPNGEYREGVNIQVSRSEGADVGALENILGNELIQNFVTQTNVSNLQCIGMHTDETSDNIYLFLTDYTATNISTISNNDQRTFNASLLNYYEGANNFIYVYNTATNVSLTLVTGAFLNFSTTNPILSINILEDLLFWTDNRNQPRRINVQSANNDAAITNPTYYTNEDQISVASYNPYAAIDLYYLNSNVYNTNGGQATTSSISSGTTPTWTISLNSANFVGIKPSFLIGAVVTWTGQPADTYVIASSNANSTTITLTGTTDPNLTSGTVLTFNKNLSSEVYVTSMLDVTSPFLPNGTDINPDYNANYSGDPDFLEDKFVRFSYRFKFEDGEVSIMSPFTQATFIPKQDGYFLDDATTAATPTGNTADENSTYRSTIVEFMENKINQILLQIPLPTQGRYLKEYYKVDEIEILYKESDALAVKVVDTISSEGSQGFGQMPDPSNPGLYIARTTDSVTYSYQGVKPYKTLPESNITRVFDKVPVRALTQEIISNRIVYGNFQDKHTPPESLEFNVGIFNKYAFNIGVTQPKSEWYTSATEYPMHTVKQNRNYQIGVVLSDRYGRSSTTLLSSKKDQGVFLNPVTGEKSVFQGGTIYHPYSSLPTNNSVQSWPGDSIKVLFSTAIGSNGPIGGLSPNLENLWPGLYNGDNTNKEYNPLGWYSYKIVVKQQEQEYYNVYLPGILNGYPDAPASPPDPANTVNFITLFGDNIDKVPADMTGVGPDQKQYRSGIQLYGRVTPKSVATPSPAHNTQFYPGTTADNVIAIANQDSMLGTVIDYKDVYQTESNPPLARVNQSSVSNPIGSNPQPQATTTAYNFLLGVYETAPVESVIDIYWETSTSGLISDLNDAINTTEDKSIVGFTTNQGGTEWIYNHYEDISVGTQNSNGWFLPSVNSTYINGEYSLVSFHPYYAGGTPVTESSIVLESVFDGVGNNRTSEFNQPTRLTAAQAGTNQDEYAISVNENFYYGSNALIEQSFTFTFTVTDLSPSGNNKQTTLTAFGSLKNIPPYFTNCQSTFNNAIGQELIYAYTARNGSADPLRNTDDLTYNVVSQTPEFPKLIIDGDGQLKEEILPARLNGKMTVEVSVTDAGQETATCVTVFNGSVGYKTVPLNNDFYTSGDRSVNGSFLIINKASESSGFYWTTNKTVNINTSPFPGAPTYPINRQTEPISGLELPTSLTWQEGTTGADQASVTVGSDGWKWINTNRTAMSSVSYDNETDNPSLYVLGNNAYNSNGNALTFGEPVGLTEGTAYLIVDFEISLTNGLTADDAPLLIWPTYLQYRENENALWQDATDIEGQIISFGQSQVNDWIISPSGSGGFENTGVISNRERSKTNINDSNYDPENAAESQVYGNSTFSKVIKATCRKVIVVGRCQAYRNQLTQAPVIGAPDMFGDYRLTVRYPAGGNLPTKASPALKIGYFPPSPYSVYVNALETQQVKLQFGDFYNPFQLGFRQNEISFSYIVSVGGSTDPDDAEIYTPQTPVFAREWAFRYVSQFYTDSLLTEKWQPSSFNLSITQNAYYVFQANENKIANASFGNDYSNIASNIWPSDIENPKNNNRKWVGQFSPSGEKIKGTCKPLKLEGTSTIPGSTVGEIYNCQNDSLSVILPNTEEGGQTVRVKTENADIIVTDTVVPVTFVFRADRTINSDALGSIKTASQVFLNRFITSGNVPSFETSLGGNKVGFKEPIPAGTPDSAYTFFTSTPDGTTYEPYIQLQLNNNVNSTINYTQVDNDIEITINNVIIKAIQNGGKLLKPQTHQQLQSCIPA